MTTTTTNAAKKLYKVFAANHDDDVIQDCKTKLNICIEENQIGVWMNVERKTLKSAYNYFHKALEQAVADGALDAKIAQFGEFADDINDINFDGKDSITAFDNIDNSFAYGIDDNTCVDLGYYFWFWVKTDEATAEDNVVVTVDTDGSEETATEVNAEEYAIFPEAMDVAVAGEYSNCARASLLAFVAMAPAINTELKRICADEIKAHYYAEKVASESKPLDESFTANVMPAVDTDTDDELIDQPDRRTVERNSGNYGTWINGEYVRFENHSIVYIDADRKRGFHFCKVNGKKFFYRQCGHKIAAAKIIERYMNGEIAAEQSKAISDFFFAHKLEVGKTFQVCFEITTADGQEHFFSRTFDTFAEAKALVDEFTSTFSEPTQIVIKQNKQNGDWYYSRDVDGTEKFFDAFCKLNATENSVKAEEKNFTANCYYTYTKDGDKRNGLKSRKFATATEAAIWILNYVRENGYTLVDGTNIRDCTNRKEYFMSGSDFDAVNAQTKVTAAEVEPGKKSTAKVDRLDELKAEKSSLISAISHSLENHFIKLDNGEFVNASDAGFTTFGFDSARPEFDKLYFKDGGEYVEVSDKAIDALHRLEVWFSYNAEAIEAEIAKTKFKFEVGKWYASDETDWNGNPCGTYRVLKRTKKFVTIYDPDIDDWNDLVNYDPDDEIDGEFDCIFHKKIQYDERGEYVNWRDDDGDLVTLCAKDETDKPVDDDDDEIDDIEDEIDAAEDNVEAESVNDEKPKHTTDDELNQPPTAEELYKMFAKTIVNANAMNVTLQNGRKMLETHFEGAYVEPEYYYKHWFIKDNLGFLFARYDTPEQVETVINMLKVAIERGDKEFTFPTVDELNQPSKDDLRGSLERAVEIARQKYREYKREGDKAGMRHESELFEICRKAIEELEVA